MGDDKTKNYDPYPNDKASQKTLDDREKEHGPQGLGGTVLREAITSYNILSCEKVIKGQNDSWIVLGRDRPGGKTTGEVGKGSTRSGMIDLVVGRHASLGQKKGDKTKLVDPDFYSDAARVYITQRGDIDSYFGIAEGSEDHPSKNRSAVAIKADHVRIVGKNHIKIVTGRAKGTGMGFTGERTSQGGRQEKAGRIDLIAGNHTEPRERTLFGWFKEGDSKEQERALQPLVKGENLKEMQTDLLDILTNIVKHIEFNNTQISIIHGLLASHFHPIGAIGPIPIAMPSPVTMIGCPIANQISSSGSKFFAKSHNYNFGVLEMNYLTEISSKYINSRHVNTT